MAYNPITDCDGKGCGKCDVCRYLNFVEWGRAVGAWGITGHGNPVELYLKEKGITP